MKTSIAASLLLAPFLLGACSNGRQPVASIPSSGVTSSNGGGQRALGDIPDVSVTNGITTERPLSRNGTGAASY